MVRAALCVIVSCGPFLGSAQQVPAWALPREPVTLFRAADTTSARIGRLTADDVLLVQQDTNAWCRVQDRHGREGFVRSSSIEQLSRLGQKAQGKWMSAVFREEARLGRALIGHLQAHDSLGLMDSERALNDHDAHYTAALSMFSAYFCRTADQRALYQLMESVAVNSGSASEEPPYRLTLALQCRSDVFKQVLGVMDSRDAGVVIEATANGIWMMFDDKDPAQRAQRDALLLLLPP